MLVITKNGRYFSGPGNDDWTTIKSKARKFDSNEAIDDKIRQLLDNNFRMIVEKVE